MKRNFIKAGLLLVAMFAQSGVATASRSLFNATMDSNIVTVTTNIPGHVYTNAGMKVNTPGYSLTLSSTMAFTHIPPTNCTTLSNGFCRFVASNTTPAYIAVYNNLGPGITRVPQEPTTPISITICLNAIGPMSCQTQIFNFTNSI